MIRRNIAAVALRRSTGVRPSKDCVVATRLFSSNSFSGTSALEQQFAEEGLRLPDYYFRSTPSVRPAPTSSPMVPRPSAAGASSQHESSSSSSSVEKFTVEDRSDAGARTNSSQHFSGQKSAQPIWKSGLSDRSTAAPELPSAPANAIQQNASQPPTRGGTAVGPAEHDQLYNMHLKIDNMQRMLTRLLTIVEQQDRGGRITTTTPNETGDVALAIERQKQVFMAYSKEELVGRISSRNNFCHTSSFHAYIPR